MKKEEFEKLFQKYSNIFWEDPKNKSAGQAIKFPDSNEIAIGMQILTKPAFKTTNKHFYFHVGQIQVLLNRNILFFIKEKDIETLVNNRWSYNPSYQFVYYEEGNHRKSY
jgi:hypothetical protein